MGSSEQTQTNGQPTAAELRAQLARMQRMEEQEAVERIQQFAASLGFVIASMPTVTPQGTLTAQWWVVRSQGN